MIFKDSVYHFANYSNHQFLNTFFRQRHQSPDPGFYLTDTTYDYSRFAIDSNGVFTKSFGNGSYFNNYIVIDSMLDLMNIIDLNNAGAGLRTSQLKYKIGLGQIFYSYTFFEHGGSEELIGYVKNGIPSGVITSIPIKELLNEFSVYPNPAKDKIHIQFATINSGKIFITDNAGRKISEKDFNGKVIEMNVSTIPTGLYFISVQNADGLFNRKIIIARD